MKIKLDFLKHKDIILAISLIIVAAGLIYGFVTGYVFDIDFKGGTRIQVDLNEEYNVSDIKSIVEGVCKQVPEAQSNSSGNNTVTITTQVISEEESNAIVDALKEKYPNMGDATVKNVQASYGNVLVITAIIAVGGCIILVLVFVAI